MSTDKKDILSSKNGITVLSLFDGISCGMLALQKANIKVNKYYASEIEECAIKISKKNFPSIIQLGDINYWRQWNIDWNSIDLIIGGSPCQGFSYAGKKLNFRDERSKLFFVYVDILNYVKSINKDIKFLLENVKMKKEYENVISSFLNTNPVRINSSLLTAAKRDRLYWSNFDFEVPIDKNISFDDINQNSNEWLSDDYINRVKNWKAQQDPIKCATKIGSKAKLPCLTARGYNQSHSGMILITDGHKYRYLSNEEAELAMTLPIGYTYGIKDKDRAKCIGNGWSVDVIAHIFKFLK